MIHASSAERNFVIQSISGVKNREGEVTINALVVCVDHFSMCPPSPSGQKPLSDLGKEAAKVAHDQASDRDVLNHRQVHINPQQTARACVQVQDGPNVTRDISQQHFTFGVILFILQAHTVHQRDIQLRIAPTVQQRGQGSAGTEAAHSSILPSLEFRLRGGSKKWKRLLQGSSLDILQNSTTIAPRALNRADCLVEPELRPFALKLLNRVALPSTHERALNPRRAMFLLLRRRRQILKEILANNRDREEPRMRVLVWYLEFVSSEFKPRWVEIYMLATPSSLRYAPDWMRRSLLGVIADYSFCQYLAQERITKAISECFSGPAVTVAEFALERWARDHEDRQIANASFVLHQIFVHQHPSKQLLAKIRRIILPQSLLQTVAGELEALVQLEYTYRANVCEAIVRNCGSVADFAEIFGVSKSTVQRMLAFNRIPTKDTYSTPLGQRYRPITSARLKEIVNKFELNPNVFCPGCFDSNSL